MRLFKVPPGKRVRITSRLVRWVEHQSEHMVAEDITWEGTTTDKRHYYKGANRMLIIDHTIDWPEYGIWQKDIECEVLNDEAPRGYKPRPHNGVLIDD